jgi:hypothetical protein
MALLHSSPHRYVLVWQLCMPQTEEFSLLLTFAVCCLPSSVCCLPSSVCCLPSSVCCLPSLGEVLPSCACSMAVNPPRTPPPPRLPHPGVAGGPAGKARSQLTVTTSRPSTSPSSPTWASVVRGEAREGFPACSGSQPAAFSVAEFSVLYEHCLASGLKASFRRDCYRSREAPPAPSPQTKA